MKTSLDISAACCSVGPDNTGKNNGTGYLIGPDHVATCAHVVGKRKTLQLSFLAAKRQATLEHINRESDCAILTLDSSMNGVTPLPLGGRVVWEDAPWKSFGFPDIAKNGVTLKGKVDEPNALDQDLKPAMQLSSPHIAAAKGGPVHGASGSPVVIEGRVAGHLKKILSDDKNDFRPAFGVVYSTRGDCIAGLLWEKKLGPDPATLAPIEPPPPDSKAANDLVTTILKEVEEWRSVKSLPLGFVDSRAAASLIGLGRPKEAVRLLTAAPVTPDTQRLFAKALWHSGDLTSRRRAIDIVQDLNKENGLDVATGDILGRYYWRKWQQTENPELLVKAYNVHNHLFRETRDPTHGVNAASVAFVLKGKSKGVDIANEVLQGLGGTPNMRLTLKELVAKGRAETMLGRPEHARDSICAAFEKQLGGNLSANSVKQNIRDDIKAAGLPVRTLGKIFPRY
jgi:Trypsin-like peptidase domain